MAKSNDMPEFHSVKVSLTENIPAPTGRPLPTAYASSYITLAGKGGLCHV